MGGIGIWQLVIILVIVLIIFGAKRLRNLGGELGGAIKSFKHAVREGEGEPDEGEKKIEDKSDRVIEGEVTSKRQEKV